MFRRMLFSIFILSRLNEANSKDDFIEVDEADNIYVGTYLIQKIKIFYINDSLFSCVDRYLPIIFKILNSNNDEIEVTGLLTEFGNLINQLEKSNCRLYKKYDNLLF